MMTLCIQGELGRRLTIEVRGYECQAPEYPWDAGWLSCSVDVELERFRGAAEASFTIQDFVQLFRDLDALVLGTPADVSFQTLEEALAFQIHLDRVGRATITGTLRDIEVNGASLLFVIETDHASLVRARHDTAKIVAEFPERVVGPDHAKLRANALHGTRPEDVLKLLSDIGDLDDVSAYLRAGEWDEPPLYKHLSHINMLAQLSHDERNRTLFGAALLHADEIVRAAATTLDAKRLRDFVCFVSILDWKPDDPITPCFLSSTQMSDAFSNVRFVEPSSPEATTTLRWLRELGRSAEFTVCDYHERLEDRELFRIYVGHTVLPNPSMPTIQQFVARVLTN